MKIQITEGEAWVKSLPEELYKKDIKKMIKLSLEAKTLYERRFYRNSKNDVITLRNK